MRRSSTSLMLSSILVIALAVAAGGCAVRGRATVTPMRAVVVAPQPTVIVAAPPPQPAASVVYGQPDPGIVLGEGQVLTGVAVPSAPPPPPTGIVTAPASRSGHVWVRGHYRWAGGHWIWTNGGWLQARARHVWVQPRYDATRGLWIQGYWTTRAPAQVSTGVVRPRSTPVRASVRIRAGASIQIR